MGTVPQSQKKKNAENSLNLFYQNSFSSFENFEKVKETFFFMYYYKT